MLSDIDTTLEVSGGALYSTAVIVKEQPRYLLSIKAFFKKIKQQDLMNLRIRPDNLQFICSGNPRLGHECIYEMEKENQVTRRGPDKLDAYRAFFSDI